MTWNRLSWTPLLVCAVTLLGCPSPTPGTPDASTPDASIPDASTGQPDASTGSEWDGGYVPLEETGNPWTDTGALSSCTFTTADYGGPCNDFSVFDLSACDKDSLANAGKDGQYMLTTRSVDEPPYFYTAGLVLRSDGGTQYLNAEPITQEERDGNARFYASRRTFPDGGWFGTMLATCEAPQAPAFTGCSAFCRNGKLLVMETFKAERLKWRAGESESSGLELVSESHVDTGYPSDIYVTKGHAYVVSTVHQDKEGGLTVFDVSNKAAPVKVKTIQLPGDNYWNGVWAKGDALYVASTTKGVNVFDISNPADPKLIRNLPSGGSAVNVHTVFVEGNRLYATATAGVLIFDVTSPLEPVELNRYAPYPGQAHDMFAVGHQLYVNYGIRGYMVVDASNPDDLRTLGKFTYPGQYSHHNAVGTFAGRTIAFEGGEGSGEHLRVLDITDPANIVKIGSFQLRPEISIHNMLLVGKKLYVAWYQEGVRVLDVSNPTRPTQVAHYNTWREVDEDPGVYFGGAIGIRVPGDGFIYVADTWRGLLILREK
ncbi:LVIVD repeat-containing protein [Archangium violaceum]|uniref:LVIVD repeat-containing protein n=1 Tax=Archangium violaceum TaxID=83451 RepID=UPI0036DD15AA